MLNRLAHIETSIARLARDGADSFAEAISDRHAIDKLKERLDRIERRLELQS
jgi:tetrahydromethanopterin S-methyltransferase subunit G